MRVCWSMSIIKSVHGDLFVQHVVEGLKAREFRICFNEGSNFKQPSATKLTMSVFWSMSTIEKCSLSPLVRPVVKGSKVKKVQICFCEGSIF